MRFADRFEAGRLLAAEVIRRGWPDPVVVGLPRGGVPVAFEVARAFDAPLYAVVVRELGVPYHPGLAMGALSEDNVIVLDSEVLDAVDVSLRTLAAVERVARVEVDRRVRLLRPWRLPSGLAGRTVVIVDDGVATAAVVRAASRVVRGRGAARVVLATPVASAGAVARLRRVVDDLVCLDTSRPMVSADQWYDDFPQPTDELVTSLLAGSSVADRRGSVGVLTR